MPAPTPKHWISPLVGYENAEPLPDKRNDDDSFYNPPTGVLSKSYETFPEPILPMPRNGFDFHSELFIDPLLLVVQQS